MHSKPEFSYKYVHLPMSSLQWAIIEQLSLFAAEEICPHGMCCLAMPQINKRHGWPMLCSIDVMSWQRPLNVMAEHVAK